MCSMSDILKKHCIPCEGGAAPLSRQAAEELGREIPTWSISENARSIFCDFLFEDFKEAIQFVNKVAELAEQEGHHPDITISWNKVRLVLSTHSIGGLSENDFILAAKIDNI